MGLYFNLLNLVISKLIRKFFPSREIAGRTAQLLTSLNAFCYSSECKGRVPSLNFFCEVKTTFEPSLVIKMLTSFSNGKKETYTQVWKNKFNV